MTHHEKMKAAFEFVAPKPDWRAPIKASVTKSMLKLYGLTIEDVEEAVGYMTATTAKVETSVMAGLVTYHVSAKGYRAGPAGP